ncbi:MAG: site-2 protease family protein [Alphaproteobacteria bacterium]|nr:site-2 protease family protein [Alphaproteobacteria bacterium]
MDFARVLYDLSIWAVPVLLAITLHEAAHGWAAYRLGDDTAERLGRVTFNPLKHVDPVGTVVVPGMLAVVGSPFLFGWAKPVPVNFWRLRHPRRDMVLVAAAGPAINVALAFASALLMHLSDMATGDVGRWVQAMIERSIVINLLLALFNMLPVLPLDGGRVLLGLLPIDLARPFARTERFGFFALIAVLVLVPLLARQFGSNIDPLATILGGPLDASIRVVLTVTGHVH